MSIHQISVRYCADHDRILLSINTVQGEEMQAWLTRRLALQLWPLLERILVERFAQPGASGEIPTRLDALESARRRLMADFRRQEVLEQADFRTPYKSDAQARPMGAHPLLLTEVNLAPLDGPRLQMRLHERLGDPPISRAFTLELQADLVFGMVQLLQQALEQSQWQQGAGMPATPAAAASDPDKPGYLN